MDIRPQHTAFIFARGGSKGVKNKNIREVGGKPLIAHSILCALESTYIDRVVVSTDSEEIAAAAREYGADVLMRPDDLAADDTPEILAWRHAIDACSGVFAAQDIFVSLPPTSPLRAPIDIDRGIEKFYAGSFDILFGITPSHANPYLSMARIDENDLLRIAVEGSAATRRQDVPDMYDITGCIYVSKPAYIQNTDHLSAGRVGYVEIPAHRALDIDTPFDLHRADLLLRYPFEGKKGEL